MTHGSLFSGIGGFDLAARWAGIETKWQVEIDNFCNKVLEKHFPDAKRYRDIKETTGLERVDIISGGFPCQPFSVAGKRRGKDDDRNLWEEMFRVITEVKPTYVIGENVANLWNMGFENLLVDLEDEGYEVESFIIPACAVGAPHRRDRIWIVGYTEYNGFNGAENRQSNNKRINDNKEGEDKVLKPKGSDLSRSFVTNTKSKRLERCEQADSSKGKEPNDQQPDGCNRERNVINSTGERLSISKKSKEFLPLQDAQRRYSQNWYEVATEFCRVDDGIPNRMDRIKSLGNAIVPQIAYKLFEAIKELEFAGNKTK